MPTIYYSSIVRKNSISGTISFYCEVREVVLSSSLKCPYSFSCDVGSLAINRDGTGEKSWIKRRNTTLKPLKGFRFISVIYILKALIESVVGLAGSS